MHNEIYQHIASLLWMAWRRRYLICIPILVMPFMGAAVSLVTPKRYDSYTTILIQEAAKQNPFLEDLTVSTNLKSRMEALNALLHSRHILAEVAVKMGMITEEMAPKDQNWVISDLSTRLRARLMGEELIKISYTAPQPDKMDEVLKLVSVRFIERVIAPQRSSISGSEQFLGQELENRRQELLEAERRLADYKTEYASELPELHSGNVARLSHLRQVLAERRTDLEGARAAQADLSSRLARTNPLVGYIEERIVEEMGRLSELRARYTDRHTSVKAALRRLSTLESERAKIISAAADLDTGNLQRLWNMAATQRVSIDSGTQPLLVSQLERLQEADSRITSLTEEVASLQREHDTLATSVASFGEIERRLTELKRDIEVKRKVYTDLSERYQNAKVTGALGRSEEKERVKLIDPPFRPAAPSNPPLLIFVIAGSVAGVFLGFGLMAVAEVTNISIYRRKAVADLLKAPVITRIPPLKVDGFDAAGQLDLSERTKRRRLSLRPFKEKTA